MPQNPNQPLSSEPLVEVWADRGGGQNTYAYPFLNENEFYNVVNGNVERRGRRTQRPWITSIGGSFTALPQGFGPGITSRVIGIAGRHPAVYSIAAGTWGSPVSQISCATSALWHVVAGQRLVGATKSDANFFYPYHNLSTDGTVSAQIIMASSTLADVTQVTIGAKSVLFWQGRTWAGNIYNGTAQGWDKNTLVWSTISDGGSFPSTQSLNIAPRTDDYIQALAPSRNTGSSLYIFKNTSVWRLDVVWGSGVYIPTTENAIDTTNSRLLLVSENTGCVAPRTICHVGSGYDSDIFFLSSSGVQSLKRVESDVAGGASEPISRPIQDVIDRITWANAVRSCAMVYDHKYYLSVPLDGATDPSVTLVFDLLRKQWIGEYSWKARDFVTIFHPGEGAGAYVKRVVPFYFSLAANASSLYDAQQCDEKSAAVPPRTEINDTYMTYQEYSRPFHFGDYLRTKRWTFAEWVVDAPAPNAPVAVYGRVDGGNWGFLGYKGISSAATYLTLPADAPWTAMATPLIPVRFDLSGVPHGRYIRFRLDSQNPSPVTIYSLRASAWPMADLWTE